MQHCSGTPRPSNPCARRQHAARGQAASSPRGGACLDPQLRQSAHDATTPTLERHRVDEDREKPGDSTPIEPHASV